MHIHCISCHWGFDRGVRLHHIRFMPLRLWLGYLSKPHVFHVLRLGIKAYAYTKCMLYLCTKIEMFVYTIWIAYLCLAFHVVLYCYFKLWMLVVLGDSGLVSSGLWQYKMSQKQVDLAVYYWHQVVFIVVAVVGWPEVRAHKIICGCSWFCSYFIALYYIHYYVIAVGTYRDYEGSKRLLCDDWTVSYLCDLNQEYGKQIRTTRVVWI